jgi:valyl-tRNA synthetase
MGIHFMGKPPFKRVLLAGMVTDENGDKMSKVKGNVIDPLDLIHGATLEQLIDKAKKSGTSDKGVAHIQKIYPEGFQSYGSDAVRYTLLSYSPQARRIALSVKRIEGYRNFCNKLWNAARYAMMQLDGSAAVATGKRPEATLLINRWILSRLDAALVTANQGLTQYRLDDASLALYHFVWNELCDWYLELTKPLLAGTDADAAKETRDVLVHVLESVLRALHPMIPFVSEDIWQRVPKSGAAQACMTSRYPQAGVEGKPDADAEREFAALEASVSGLRDVRSANDIPMKTKIPAFEIRTDDAKQKQLLEQPLFKNIITTLTGTLDYQVRPTSDPIPEFAAVASGGFVMVPLEGLVDMAKEKERVTRELVKVDKDLTVLSKKLGNADFVARAPAEVVAKDTERKAELEAAQSKLRDALAKMG